MIDLGVALTVFAGIGIFYLIRGLLIASRPRTEPKQGICRCLHSFAWHQHHHDRTYCAACKCTRFDQKKA